MAKMFKNLCFIMSYEIVIYCKAYYSLISYDIMQQFQHFIR